MGAVVYQAPARPAPEAAPSFRARLANARVARLAAPSARELGGERQFRGLRLVGFHRDVPEEAIVQGTWETTETGERLYRVAIQSPGASSVRVWFSDFSIGEGKLWVRGTDEDADREAPYTGAGEFGDGQFWSASVKGDTLAIEYVPAEGAGDALPFRVTRVSHRTEKTAEPEGDTTARGTIPVRTAEAAMTVGPLADEPETPRDPALACNIDVSCYSSWSDSARGVGLLAFEVEGGTATCSGSLIRTRNDTNRPYLLTAAHCISTETEARSLEVFWTYQTSQCLGTFTTERGTVKSNTGSSLVRTSGLGAGDSSIILLRDVPSGVRFLDWNPGDVNDQAPVTGVHHPKGSMKKISHGNRNNASNVVIDGTPLDAEYFYGVTWRIGTTEQGSSGSPLFDAPGIITGILSYGPVLAQCELGTAGYGRMSTAYEHYRDILEDIPTTNVTPDRTLVEFTVTNGNPVPGQAIRVTTASVNAVQFNIRPDADWIKVSTGTASTSASAPATFTISVDEGKLKNAGSYQGSVSILNGTADPVFITVRARAVVDKSRVVLSGPPNPVPRTEPDADGAQWRFALALDETAGVSTTVTGIRVDGVDYSSQIANWFGTSQLPARGRLSAPLRVAHLFAPTSMYFEVSGVDDASGTNWSQTIVIHFE